MPTIAPFAFLRFFSYAEPFRPLAKSNRSPPSSLGLVVQHATHVASLMARSGRRPAAPRSSEPQRRRLRLSSPGLTPIPREARKSRRQHPPLRSSPSGASPIVLGPADRHRGRGGRGLETQTGEVTWLPSVDRKSV